VKHWHAVTHILHKSVRLLLSTVFTRIILLFHQRYAISLRGSCNYADLYYFAFFI